MLASGAHGRAAVPSGASTGAHEAVELRDGDAARYGGKGVLTAVGNVNDHDRGRARRAWTRPTSAASTRRSSSSTARRTRATWAPTPSSASSLAVARAAAVESGLPLYRYVGGADAHVLPVPMMNVLNGGVHADRTRSTSRSSWSCRSAPQTFAEALRMGRRDVPRAEGAPARARACDRGRRRGRLRARPRLERARRSRLIVEAIGTRRLQPGEDVAIALDPASTELLPRRRLPPRGRGPRRSSSAEMVGYLRRPRATATRSSRSRTAWPRTTGTAGSC